jgi:hypothetical protein
MPIDASIYRAQQPVQIQTPNPLELIQAAGQAEQVRSLVEARRLAADAARQKAADDAAERQAFTEAGGDVPAALKLLYPRAPARAAAREKEWQAANKDQVEAMGKGLENQKKQLDHLFQVWGLVKDQPSLEAIRPLFVKTFPHLDAALPTEYGDGSAVQRVSDAALSRKDQLEQKQKIVELFANGKFHEALGNVLSQPDITPQKWDEAITGAIKLGMPKEVGDQFGGVGGFSPANVANAGRLAISAKDRETLAGQAAMRAQTEAHQTTQEELTRAGQAQTAATAAAGQAIARGQLDVARGHLAVAEAAEKRQEAGKGIKLSPTQQEDMATMMTVQQLGREALTLGQTTQWAGVGPISGRVGATPLGSGGASGEALRNKLGNIQGTIAKLRGGTSFTPNEQKLLESYTPTITDTDAKIQTKLATLNEFIENKRQNTLRVAAGVYTLPAPGGGTGDGGVGVSVTAPDGKTYTFPTAAAAAAFKQRAGIR